MIELFYLTHILDPTSSTTQGQGEPESNEGVLYILQTLRLESRHQVHFNVICRTFFSTIDLI